ncbi:uncharacterized protein F4807DRAFT_461835 [Annulohypoxylon truncatum]|uniref:uncharacterized protein n=1 Tax=Annulohypoxylon truncatum TaxID=327061 RepID=UPI00200762C9|nr:uncharacterized protein F4807DRAFT_461835 [Annulohypoxylon truncatum]KAI1208510.1 hypothetical protein F4807DRAFT_461835 [Annulohypoxylon truncatum]
MFLPIMFEILFMGLTVASPLVSCSSDSPEPSQCHLQSCKNIPGDQDWPLAAEWQSLNGTLGGRLIAAKPIAHVCHAPDYSEAACSVLKNEWDTGSLMSPSPVDIQAPWFQNQSCVPFTDVSKPCELGNLASYSINVTGVEDVKAGIAFSKSHNIRLSIKNSGHDWNGKSTGKGTLSLWTRNMKSRQITTYNSSFYSGPVLKAGAGVTGGEAAEFVAEHGYRVVTGDSPTVALAGGYTQGGGHSQLSGQYGIGADQVVEWEVITASGDYLVASPLKNSDLYWALSGGGGGTYGVVVGVTVRLHEDGQVASAYMAFSVDNAGGVDEFWNAIGAFHDELQILVDTKGVVADYLLRNDSLTVFTITAPGYTADTLSTLLDPLILAITQSGSGSINKNSLNLKLNEADGYYNLYSKTLGPLINSSTESPVMGGRMVLRDNYAKNKSAVIDSFRNVTDGGEFYMAATALNTVGAALLAKPVASNAVQPQWRDAFLSINIISQWDWNEDWKNAARLQADMVDRIIPVMEAATPGSAVYLNEGNWAQPDWQHAFYGSNYERLLKIKKKYDPDNVFYALTAVGSDSWSEDITGKLCRIN